MPAEPSTFIIVVNWNGRDDTLECLASLKNLTGANLTIVVVDNGSTDGSVEAIHGRFPAVTVLETRRNLRFAGGNNQGIRYALGHGAEQIMLLNNDTTIDPEAVRVMTECMHTAQDIGVVAPKILFHSDTSRLWYAGGEISLWSGTMRHVGIREPDDGRNDISGETGYASGCCFLTLRKVVEKVGLLDESFFMYAEDADWCMRVRQAGYRIMYEPRARVWHKISASAGGHLSRFKLKNKLISNYRFMMRYASWYHWFVFPWLSVLVNAAATVRYLSARR